ncbi:MAG: hypothetical protein AB7N99_03075 [Simkaniaceae bacterium]
MDRKAATKEIAVNRDAQGFSENSAAAKMGGKIAGDARKELEFESGKKVTSKENFLKLESRALEVKIEEDHE